MRNTTGVMELLFVVLTALTVAASEHCNSGEDGDCQIGNEHLNPAHAYEESHQVDFLFAKEIDGKLNEVKLPETFDDIKRSLKACGCRVSNDAITAQDADHAQSNANREEATTQEARALEDRRRMEARLEVWPPNKPKGVIYMIVKALPYRVNMLKGEMSCPFNTRWLQNQGCRLITRGGYAVFNNLPASLFLNGRDGTLRFV